MERVLAEEIRDFDTSLDRLWARQDLIVLATGALLCLRSLYRRAQRIGALGRFRYAVLRAEDYVLGTAEEEIRRSVRAVAALPGARVIVLYLSCLDILTRPDFADMEQRLSAETGGIVRCFFRGPLAKADGITHETAEDILAALPPAVGAVTARAPLPPPVSDVAGAADFLHADGAATVLVTPSGCRNALARMDLLPARTDVYALIPKAEDYIFGMEDTAAEEVGALAAKGQHREIRVLTSPVPAFMAMAAEPVLAAAEAYDCHAEACPMDGFRDAYAGAAAVELRPCGGSRGVRFSCSATVRSSAGTLPSSHRRAPISPPPAMRSQGFVIQGERSPHSSGSCPLPVSLRQRGCMSTAASPSYARCRSALWDGRRGRRNSLRAA